MLERAGRIKTRRATLYRHYYPASIIEERHEVILAFLWQETSRDILIHLLELPAGATQTEIVGFTGLSAPTISWHMSRLITSGLLTNSKEGRTVRYVLSNSVVNEIAKILKTYHPSIWNVLASRLAELFLELSSKQGRGT
jgi:predicted transcriptional regulator